MTQQFLRAQYLDSSYNIILWQIVNIVEILCCWFVGQDSIKKYTNENEYQNGNQMTMLC